MGVKKHCNSTKQGSYQTAKMFSSSSSARLVQNCKLACYVCGRVITVTIQKTIQASQRTTTDVTAVRMKRTSNAGLSQLQSEHNESRVSRFAWESTESIFPYVVKNGLGMRQVSF